MHKVQQSRVQCWTELDQSLGLAGEGEGEKYGRGKRGPWENTLTKFIYFVSIAMLRVKYF